MILLCQQKKNSEISKILLVGKRTIENRRAALILKTKSENSIGIVLYAIKNGIYKL